MKRTLAVAVVILVVVLALTAAACGGSTTTTTAASGGGNVATTAAPAPDTTAAPAPDTTAAPAETPKTIGVSFPQDTNPLYIAMKKGIEARAAELGWKIVAVSANENIAQQISGIEDLIAQKVDGILVSPVDSVAVNSAYESAQKAGIPIISLARSATSPAQSAVVKVDEKQIGKEIGQWIVDKLGGKGKVALIEGPPGANAFRAFGGGVEEALAAAPGISVVFKKQGSLERERGLKDAEDILIAHPDINAIYAANDDLALGASQAIASAGKTGKVILTGMNGTPPALKAVKGGTLSLTVDLNGVEWGKLGLDTMAEYLKGNKPTAPIIFKHIMVDSSNIDQILASKQ